MFLPHSVETLSKQIFRIRSKVARLNNIVDRDFVFACVYITLLFQSDASFILHEFTGGSS